MYKVIFLVIALLVTCISTTAQTTEERCEQLFNNIKEALDDGRPEDAIPYAIQHATLHKEVDGENSASYLDTLEMLALVFFEARQVDNLLSTLNEAIAICKANLPKTVEQCLKFNIWKLEFCNYFGLYDSSMEAGLYGMELLAKYDVKDKDEKGFEIMYEIGRCYTYKGEHMTAVKVFEQLATLANGRSLKVYAEAMRLKSHNLSIMGNPKEARDNAAGAYNSLLKMRYEDYSLPALLLIDMANYNYSMEEFEECMDCLNDAYEIILKYGKGEDNELMGHLNMMWAIVHLIFNRNDKVIETAEQAISYYEKEQGKHMDEIVSTLGIMSMAYVNMSQADKAVKVAEKAMSLAKSSTKKEMDCHANLAGAYFAHGDYGKMVESCHEYTLNLGDLINRRFYNTDHYWRQMIWTSIIKSNSIFKLLLKDKTLEALAGDSELGQCTYDVALITKGMLQSSERLILQKKNYGEEWDNMFHTTWNNVKTLLVPNCIAVEFLCSSDSVIVASIISKQWENPRAVRLCHISELMPLSDDIYSAYTTPAGYHLVWERIIQEADIQPGDVILFSPDGILNILNAELFPIHDGTTMSDKYGMVRLSSTRRIAESTYHDTLNTNKAHFALFGGLRYDQKTPDTHVIKPIVSDQEEASDKLDASNNPVSLDRGTIIETIKTQYRDGFTYLPSSKREVESIADVLTSAKVSPQFITLYEESEGTEASVMSLSGNAPDVLHIATHGFYIQPSLKEKERGNAIAHALNDRLPKQDKDDTSPIDYGMTHTGLLLSGAMCADTTMTESEDGILTSQEIGRLNLEDTNLVVLSACHTGIGTMTIDGISGLQRGFKIAGAGTIIMSLWKVDDNASALMMKTFYEELTRSHSKRQAFKVAQEYMRKTFDNPFYWAAYVMLD